MEPKREDVMKRISQLRRLQLSGEISESEFEDRKENILAEARSGSRASDPDPLDIRLPTRDTEARDRSGALKVIVPAVGLVAVLAAVWFYGDFAHTVGRDSVPPPRLARSAPPPAVAEPAAPSPDQTAMLPDSASTLPAPPPKAAAGANVPPPLAVEPVPSNDREAAVPLNPENNAAAPPVVPLSTQTAASLPTAIGRCAQTIVTNVVRRPFDKDDPAMANFGSAIQYKNGGNQISAMQNVGIDASMPGDRVQICLVARPHNCPSGDNQGAIYHALNLRTRLDWDAPNSERVCAG